LRIRPKLYEYFGVLVMFYSNEHEPVHVHGKFQGRESRAELILVDGLVTEIRYSDVAGRAPLGQSEMRYFEEVVSARAAEIVTSGSTSSSCTNRSSRSSLPGG